MVSMFFLLPSSIPAQTAEEEPYYSQLTRAVARLEQHVSTCVPGLEWSREDNVTVGSAFFVEDSFKGQSRFFIVTARHNVENAPGDLFARVQKIATGKDYAVLILPKSLWTFHPTATPQGHFPVDVAVMQITIQPFIKAFLNCPSGGKDGECGRDDKTNRPKENQLVGSPSVLERVIFLGFPGGEVAKDALEPFARGGLVAYTTTSPDYLTIDNKLYPRGSAYLIDATTLSGNSGGPVLREPLPLKSGVYVWGLVTGGSRPELGRHYTIVTRPEKIAETLAHTRLTSKPNNGWSTNRPSLPVRCVPDK